MGAANATQAATSLLQLIGAGGFGALMGWFIYYINRYRKADVQIGDLTTVVGTIGGAAVLGLFPAKSDLFGAYGMGLFAGFFGYFIVLVCLVAYSKNFDSDWFLDGRKKKPVDPYYIPGDAAETIHPMAAEPTISATAAAVSSAITATASSVASLMGRPLPASAMAALSPVPAASGRAADIIKICEAEWPTNRGDCSGFVRDVCAALNVVLIGDANAIVNEIQGPSWDRLLDGLAAKQAADSGKLVIGGLCGADETPPAVHGHVVVVVSGPLDPTYNKYPTAYWGKLGGVGEEAKTINWAWKREDRNKVIYGSRTV